MITSTDKLLIEKLKALPIDYWDFREDDTKEYTHGLHNYFIDFGWRSISF